MKLINALWWASAVAQVCAASPEAYVYLSDKSQQDNTPPSSVSPNEARLLFARRLGLSRYHSLGDASESTLELLNAYGGPQEQLFGGKRWEEHPRRLLAIVEGVQQPEGILKLDILDTSM